VRGRAVLRTLLGRYLQLPAEQLIFSYGPHGKPGLSHPPGLAFNIAHADDVLLCAVTRLPAIGIDVEAVRPFPDMPSVAATVFSEMELQTFVSLPAHQRTLAFFRGWTRKEAFVKTIGDGLAFPLKRFDVALHPDLPAGLLRLAGDSAAAASWTFREIVPTPGYVATVAVPGPVMTIRLGDIST
jgi:4'-phosphopantetheinyl transferase